MKYKLSKVLGFQEPSDGLSDLEKQLQVLIINSTVQTLYAKLPTARMKFIVAAHFELGYTQDMLAEMLGVRQETLKEEIELIKMVVLGYKYKPRKFKDNLTPADVLHILTTLVLPFESRSL